MCPCLPEAANVSASTPLPADEPTKSSKKAKHAKESAYSTPRVSATVRSLCVCFCEFVLKCVGQGRARRIAAPDHFHFEGGVVESEAQQLIRCRRLIEALVKLPKAKMFSAPVDWQTYGLLDYPRIVPHPMDLGKNLVFCAVFSTVLAHKFRLMLRTRFAQLKNICASQSFVRR